MGKFVLLNDINKNLEFLSKYCDSAAGAKAFGMSNAATLTLIRDDLCKPETYSEVRENGDTVIKFCDESLYGKKPCMEFRVDGSIAFFGAQYEVDQDQLLIDRGIKLDDQTLIELRIFGLADLLVDLIERDELHQMNRVFKSRDYCHEVLRVSHILVTIPIEERMAASKERISNTNKLNARKPRLKTTAGKLAIDEAEDMFKKWNAKPSSYKNKAAFQRNLVDSGYCLDYKTAATWLHKFLAKNELSDGLKHLFKIS